MSYSNQTEHYGLPLPTGSDKSSWLDTNEAFTYIDSELYRAVQSSGGSTEAIEELQQGQSTLTERVTQTNTNLTQEIADRTAGDATLASRLSTAEGNINNNHTNIQEALEEIHAIINTLNGSLDDLRFNGISLTTHSNLTKAGIIGNVDNKSMAINNLMVRISFANFRNNTDAAITFTNGIALSSGDYLIPFYTIPAAVANEYPIFSELEVLSNISIGRIMEHAYPASGSDRHFITSYSMQMTKQSSGLISIGILSTSATLNFAARRVMYIYPWLVTNPIGSLPEDIEE